MKINQELSATGESIQGNESKEQSFCEEELNRYFDIPDHFKAVGVEKDEIKKPFLIPADYEGYGGGFRVKKDFFKSKYYSQAGLLWMLDYLQEVQDKVVAEENSFYGEINDQEQDESDEFWEVDDEKRNMLQDNETKDLYDYELYLQRSFVLGELARVETNRETTDKIIDFLERDFKSHVYTSEIAKVFIHADVNYAAKKLLQKLQNNNETDKHSQYKNDLAKIIYRLEFGQISISKDGVKYLEKMYDLGELNNPDYFAQRLTAKGDIGVFDENRDLQVYFNVGDLTSDEKTIKPKIHEFIYETLFFSKEGETKKEKNEREKYLKGFKKNYFDFYDDNFFEETGVRFNNLDFKEQGQFLVYYKNCDEAQKASLLNFVKSFGENGLRTFLSLEHGGQKMGDKILSIGERLDQKTANAIFLKYGEIVDKAQNVEGYLKEQFGEEHISQATQVAENLLRRGKALLVVFADDENIDSDIILGKLDEIDTDILLVKESIKSLPKKDVANLDLSKIKGIEKIKNKPVSDIYENQKLVEKIKTIIDSQFPEGDGDVFIGECKNNEKLKITISLAGQEVLSFFTTEKVSENIQYVDWFIANPDAPIKGLGEATIRLLFKEQDNKKDGFYAVAKPHAKSFLILVENLGFVSFKGSTEDGEYKHHYARIRKIEGDREFTSKNIPQEENGSFREELKRKCDRDNEISEMSFRNSDFRVCKISYNEMNHKKDIKKEDPEGWILQEIENQYREGYVLTRFIPENINSAQNKTFYVVFEKDKESSELKKEIEAVIQERSSHSDSKKAESI